MLIYWVGFFMWLGAAFIAGLLIGQRNRNTKASTPSASHNRQMIDNCPWCDDEGWYYPTGDNMPKRIRCDHK